MKGENEGTKCSIAALMARKQGTDFSTLYARKNGISTSHIILSHGVKNIDKHFAAK